MMVTMGCRFSIGRKQLAQIVSHDLYWRRSFGSVQFAMDLPVHRGRGGVCEYVRRFIRDFGLRGVCWCKTADNKRVKARAYELVDEYFSELRK